jgi:hypothetical protein
MPGLVTTDQDDAFVAEGPREFDGFSCGDGDHVGFVVGHAVHLGHFGFVLVLGCLVAEREVVDYRPVVGQSEGGLPWCDGDVSRLESQGIGCLYSITRSASAASAGEPKANSVPVVESVSVVPVSCPQAAMVRARTRVRVGAAARVGSLGIGFLSNGVGVGTVSGRLRV